MITIFRWLLSGSLVAQTLLLVGAGKLDDHQLRSEAQERFNEGNWNDALKIWNELLSNDELSDNAVEDLRNATHCLNQLGRTDEIDVLLLRLVEKHPSHWKLVLESARQLSALPPYGMVSDQEFQRPSHRQRGGVWRQVAEQDRSLALIWLEQALPIAEKSASAEELAEFYLQIAHTLLRDRDGKHGWRLQSLTDLTTKPNYLDLEAPQHWPERNAPAIHNKPIYHNIPGSWKDAKSDGERLRWAISQSIEVSPQFRDQAKLLWAHWLQSQFSVNTLAQERWFLQKVATTDVQAGILAIHTLSDDETLARLASGIHRFELPKDQNPIRIFEEVFRASTSEAAANAGQLLVDTYLNRRQYEKAAAILREAIDRFGPGPGDFRVNALNDIIQPRGALDPVGAQPAGQGAKLSMVFRNAKHAEFVAKQIDLEAFFQDLKNFYKKSQRGQQEEFLPSKHMSYPPPIEHLEQLFTDLAADRYTKVEAAKWALPLEPRPGHWDRRIEVSTPLQKAGLYLVTCSLDGGQHYTRTLVWIHDTAVVRKNLDQAGWYAFVDARTGEPLSDLNVEFFGFRMDYRADKVRLESRNFAKKSDQQGEVILNKAEASDQFQWMVMARNNQGRLGILGFQNFWFPPSSWEQFEQLQAYGVADRPVYRPGDTVHAKFWLGKSTYGGRDDSKLQSDVKVQISINDPQGTRVHEATYTTDKFGAVNIEFIIPKQAKLGAYSFNIQRGSKTWIPNSLRFRVEEYRKPEFEVNILAPDKPVALGEKIQAKVQAKYYFGSPVTDAHVEVRVNREAYEDAYFPIRPFDWCYGGGYWWFSYDYPWYPGWSRWVGCRMPRPWWFPRFRSEPPELILEQELKLDENGEATIEIDSNLAKELFGDQDHRYSITAEVRDASRRTIVAEGSVLAARQAFKIYAWVDRGYYNVGDAIQANFEARRMDGKGVPGSGTLQLLSVTYDKDRKPIEKVVQEWKVSTDEQGLLQQKLQASKAGQYRLKLELDDGQGHVIEGGYLFTVRGEAIDPNNFRFAALELIPDKMEYQVGDKVKLQVNADRDGARVWLFVKPSGQTVPKPVYLKLTGKSQVIEIDVRAEDQPNFFVEALTVYDGELHESVREIIVPPISRELKVTLDADKAEYLPGEEAVITGMVQDAQGNPVEASMAVAVYDRSLEQIAPDVLPGDIREFFWKWRRHYYASRNTNLDWKSYPIHIEGFMPWSALGIFGHSIADEEQLNQSVDMAMATEGLGGMGGGGIMRRGRLQEGPMPPMASGVAPYGAWVELGKQVMEKVKYDRSDPPGAPADRQSTQASERPSVRKDFADAALWLGSVSSGSDGKIQAKFKMPENISSWRMKAWSVGTGVRVGSATSETVTRKRLMVRLQIPRFLVERDEVVLSAIVHNETDQPEDVRVWMEIDGETQLEFLPSTPIESTVRIEAHAQKRVDFRCKATAEGKAIVRALATTSKDSDAMQLEIPIEVRGMLKTDIWAGTIRPDLETSKVTITVPAERRADQSRLTIRMSPSLALAMVDALPYLAEYPYGCTEQTLNRFLPTVITQRTLQRMNVDLKRLKEARVNLNAQELGDPAQRVSQWKRFEINPVYDADLVDEMVAAGVQRLTDMQVSDGGWGWFSGALERSYPHTTAVVVNGLLLAQENDVAIVPDVIERGLQWLGKYQDEELRKLKNAATQTVPFKSDPDNLDALVFNILVRANRPNPEMQNFLYEKRGKLSVYGKALLALATHQLGNADQTNMLRRNIEQFLVEDAENETAYLDDRSPWWYWYGSHIEGAAAYLKLLSAVEPNGRVAPRLIKYLLNNRKHATYWSSTRDTAMVLDAFADYLKATGEGQTELTVTVLLDGKNLGTVEFQPGRMFETNNTIEIFGEAIKSGQHELELRRSGKGPLYWNVYSTNFTIEDKITPAGLEVKIERKYYRLDRVQKSLELADDLAQVVDTKRTAIERTEIADLQSLPPGTLVEVELLVESKNDYEYLMIEDRKPACLEVTATQSGYVYDGGAWAYREFRDQSTTFFIRQLPQGKLSLRYSLRTEAPGEFTAMPAIIHGMYAPELIGNSQNLGFRIEE